MPKTLGQIRVRSGFNPSEDPKVAELKTIAAKFIDLCEEMKDAPSLGNEKNRVLAIAQTEIETAAMYAVKGATFNPAGTAVSPGPVGNTGGQDLSQSKQQ